MDSKSPNIVLNLYEDDHRWEEDKYKQFLGLSRLDSLHEVKGHTEVEADGYGSDTSEARKDRAWAELNSRRMKPRRTLIRKEGQSNVAFRGIQKKRTKYLKDLYITLLDCKWRYATLMLFAGFFLCYFTFSIIYFLLAYTHGDLDHIGDPNFKPCIENLESYWDALLFSIETQSTIGYGTIYPHAECAGTVPTVFIQITVGFFLETMLLGLIFVKIARPKHRRHTLIFSRNACLCKEDGKLNLQVRVGDMRSTHLIDTHVYGVLVKRYVSQEKYVYPLFQHELDFQSHGMGDRLFLMWPMVLKHTITPESVLYTLTPEDLLYDKFELVVFLEGTIESTGEMVQARTSYTSKEILWGHRFAKVEEYDEKNDKWIMDFVKFNNVVPSKTPRCSAKQWAEDPTMMDNRTEEADAGKESPLMRGNIMNASEDTLNYSTASETEAEAERSGSE